MIEKFPKLVQKFALQPHLCYDLMCVWEENCLDLLLNDELVGGFILVFFLSILNRSKLGNTSLALKFIRVFVSNVNEFCRSSTGK